MLKKIMVKAGQVSMSATLNDSGTAGQVWQALPVKAEVNTWGEEIYFSIPIKCQKEDARDVVEEGDLGYWPPGSAFCVFFGPTPGSTAGRIKPASPVNLIGKLDGNPKEFKKVKDGDEVTVEKYETGECTKR